MKKLFLVQLFLFGLLSIYSANPVIISGKWNREGSKEVKLFRTISGRLEEMVNYKLGADSKFAFAFEPDQEGFYTIGNDYPGAALNKYTFYLKPGDKLSVDVNDSSYVLTGTNTPENMAMEKWHNTILSLEWRAVYWMKKYGRYNGIPSTYVDFFPYLEEFAGKAQSYTSDTKNKVFENTFSKYRNFNILYDACLFVQSPKTAHPEKDDFGPYYKNIDLNKLTTNTDLFDYPFGISLLELYNSINMKLNEPETDAKTEQDYRASFNNFLSKVKNDTIKGELAISRAERGPGMKSLEQYEEFNTEYGKYMLTQDQKDRLTAQLIKINKGKKSIDKTIDFSGFDLDEKKVSLSDFKGKVVYVDVWATWCGPCRKELPYMKKLEEEYTNNKDIVFLSISIDDVKDKQKWADYVRKEELKGVQLFGGKGKESDVATFYNITGIPRFMLFDKQGNIVSNDAPRPSETENIKSLFEKLLK